MALVAMLAAACSGSSDVATTSSNDYCYIKSVTLGTVKRKTPSINTSYAAGTFLMTIDHRSLTIENRDSLPYGTLLDRVVVTIAFDGSVLTYREKGSEAGWTAYSATDSLDLTRPLELHLTSNDNLSSRTYTLKVNVHKQEGDSISWEKLEGSDIFASMTDMKAITFEGKPLVVGKKEAGIVLAERSSAQQTGTWTETALASLPATTDVQTLRKCDGILYVSTADGQIFTSSDARQWQQTGTTHSAGLTLVEKTDSYFYALSEGRMLCSVDATEWEEDLLDSPSNLLPTHGIRTLTMQQDNGNQRIIMLGEREDHDNSIVWNKMWNENEKEPAARWTYFPVSPDNTIPCPILNYLNLIPYDGKCIALGGASTDGTIAALSQMYVSQDYGITWRPSTNMPLPAELNGTEGCIAATVSIDNFIWIITKSQIWRGRLNKLGFAH